MMKPQQLHELLTRHGVQLRISPYCFAKLRVSGVDNSRISILSTDTRCKQVKNPGLVLPELGDKVSVQYFGIKFLHP